MKRRTESPERLVTTWVRLFLFVVSLTTFAQPVYETNVFVETIAGSGFAGYIDGQGNKTMFSLVSYQGPSPLVVDRSTNVYLWDAGNTVLRVISPLGEVTTYPATLTSAVDGKGTNAGFERISRLFLDDTGNVLAVDADRVRTVGSDGEVRTRFNWRSLTGDSLSGPVAVSTNGDYFLGCGRVVKKMTKDGKISVFAGSGNQGSVDGQGVFCSFSDVFEMFFDPSGNLIVADEGAILRKVAPDATVTTFGRIVTTSGNPHARCACDPVGNIVAADDSTIMKIRPDGGITLLAGHGGFSVGYVDGEGVFARFYQPCSVFVGKDGRIYLSDSGNQRIRRISYSSVPTESFGLKFYSGLTLTGPIGKTYRIEYVDQLGDTNNWRQGQTITLPTTPYTWFDPDSASVPRRFYRAVPGP